MRILSRFKELSMMKKIICIVLVVGIISVAVGGDSKNTSKKILKK